MRAGWRVRSRGRQVAMRDGFISARLRQGSKLGAKVLDSSCMAPLFVLSRVRYCRGYQSFFYTKHGLIADDAYTRMKKELVEEPLRRVLPGSSVLDLGSAEGFFSLYAGTLRAKEVLGIEKYSSLVEKSRRIAGHMGLESTRFEVRSIFDLEPRMRSDVVFAFAIVHWFIHTERPQFRDADSILDFIGQFVGRHLLVEYVTPDDPTFIQDRGFREVPRDLAEAFSAERFVGALRRQFSAVEFLGRCRPTRDIYLASR